MIKVFVFYVFLTVGMSSGFDPEKHKNWKLLPHDICGQVDSNRIIGGEEAAMNSYPWLARIGYKSPSSKGVSFLCGGTLVSSKAVLSAAHCVTDLDGSKVVVIRLGEHNTETDPDCQADFCADPVIDIQPSEILIPRNFNVPLLKNDIALIRLKNEVKFSPFVRPICLGNKEFMKKDFVGSMTETAGWGIFDLRRGLQSTTLLFIRIPVVKLEICKKSFPNYVDIGLTQLCAGGVIGIDSCRGDSGGPLMKVDDGPNGPRYYVLGIVSFGDKKCGKSNKPGVYTNVPKYTKWLLDNLDGKKNDSINVPSI